MPRTRTVALLLTLSVLGWGVLFALVPPGVRAEVSDAAYNALQDQYQQLLTRHRQTVSQYRELEAENGVLRGEVARCQQLLGDTRSKLQVLDQQVHEQGQLSPPYTLVSQRKVLLVWRDTDSSLRTWELPMDAYRQQVTRPRPAPRFLQLEGRDGRKYRVMDFRPWVDAAPFQDVVARLFRRAGSAEAFVREVWYTVAQLTTYRREITETPRWPLETLVENGGDCEDTAILTASLLKAAPVSLQVELVYFDAANPEVARSVNHIGVQVTLPDGRSMLLETTSQDQMTPYGKVDGWYLPTE